MKLPNWKGSTAMRRLEFVKTVLKQKPVADTTKSYQYSNAGYAIAAQMFEKASGKTWEQLLAETMQSQGISYVLGFPNRTDEKQPWGHMDGLLGRKPTGPKHDYKLDDFAAPAGDVSMNIENYARWIQLHLAGLEGKSNFVSAENIKKMHLGLPEYAFGWGNAKKEGVDWSAHDGSTGTFYAHASIRHSDGRAFVILANSADKKTVEAIYALKKVLVTKF